jgi:hypothetical protein
MENKDKSKQNEHDSGMFQVKEISRTNKNDGINLVLPISINGRKIDGIVDTGAQIAISITSEEGSLLEPVEPALCNRLSCLDCRTLLEYFTLVESSNFLVVLKPPDC